MAKKIIQILSKPYYPYFYGIAFLNYKSAAYFGTFRIFDAVWVLSLYCITTFILLQLFKKITSPATAAVITILLWASLFHVAGAAQLLGYYYAYIPLSFYLCFYCFVLLSVFSICRYSFFLSRVLTNTANQYINAFLLVSTIVLFVTGLLKMYDTSLQAAHHHYKAKSSLISPKKDIVWILMDEYGSSDALKEEFNFCNPLDSFLERNQFIVPKNIHSRYNVTLYSVNSILNLDDSIRPSGYYEGIDLLNKGSLVPLVEQNGYDFVNLSFFNISKHPMLEDRSGYPNTYLQQIISGTLMGLIYQEWKYTVAKSDQYSRLVLKKLNDTLLHKSKHPRFIWAHLPIPHAPFCRNSLGKLQKDTAINATDTILTKRKYIEYLEYGNWVIVSLIKNHPDLSDKIIIISGDHGPRFPCLSKKEFQKWPFVAIHLPKPYDTTGLRKLEYVSQLPDFIINMAVDSMQSDHNRIR